MNAGHERIKWIDNAKGIAMLFIIIGHVSGELSRAWNFNFIYEFHLVMFFLLSGYTLKPEPLNKEYINKKFNKLMIPYFYTCLAVLCMDVVNVYAWNKEGTIASVTEVICRDLIRSFFGSGAYTNFGGIELGTRIGAVWFLPALFFSNIVFQMLLHVLTDRFLLGIASVTISVLAMISAKFIWLPFSVQSGMMAVFFVWIGYEVKRTGWLSHVNWRHYLCAGVVFVLGIWQNYLGISMVVADGCDWIVSPVVALSGCLLIYLVSKHMQWSKVISYVGRNSLEVLCVHLFVLETLGVWVVDFLNWSQLTAVKRAWVLIGIEIALAILGCLFVKGLRWIAKVVKKSIHTATDQKESPRRDSSVDVCRGIFIIAMLVGHFPINFGLRTVIYSCHMVAFVFLSGYFYKKSESVLRTLAHMCKTFLVPYVIAALGNMVLNIEQWSYASVGNFLKRYILGFSATENVMAETEPIGPIYFILLLFVTRLLYLMIDRIVTNEALRWVVVLIISLTGVCLGISGYWLPWSVDIACYSIIFYQIGIFARKYELLSYAKEHPAVYFLLAPMWVYMISCGGVELVARNFGGQYGAAVIGSVAGILVVYQLSCYIVEKLPLIARFLQNCGQYSIIILVGHVVFGKQISDLVAQRFRADGACYMTCSIMLQIFLFLIVAWMKKKFSAMNRN